MKRLRVMAMVLVSSLAMPASVWAQMNFDGLDVGKKKKTTKKKKPAGDDKKPDAKDAPNPGPAAVDGVVLPAAVDLSD